MTRARRLLELQEIDLERDRQVVELARVVAKLRGSPAVAEARDALAAAEAALAVVEPVLRTQTAERESVKEHIGREEKKLYGGRVKDPRELQNFQKEVESLKRRLTALDDTVLETMLQRDEAAERIEECRHAVAAAEDEAATEGEALTRRKRELTAAVRGLDAARSELVEAIPGSDREIYERLRKSKGGRAVAALSDGACDACGMQLPLQDAARVQSGGPHVYCPGCGRVVLG